MTLDRVLNYEKPGKSAAGRRSPELFYIEWMDACLRQDAAAMEQMRERLQDLRAEGAEQEGDGQKRKEIILNIAYTDPGISTKEWMELLREETEPGRPVRLYFILGESVSYLSGLRDLSELFACGKKERETWRELWEERLAPEDQIPYRLAQMEYEYQTDSASARAAECSRISRKRMRRLHGRSGWERCILPISMRTAELPGSM